MHSRMRVVLLAVLLNMGSLFSFSQLRNNSPYERDRINTEQTKFTLHENNTADFVLASEWTHYTAYDYPEKVIIFVWHFKDGTKAYVRQGDVMDEAGKGRTYLMTDKSSTLEDKNHKKVQPMTRTNPPVKVELWLGKVDHQTGFETEMLVDTACFDAQSVEVNRAYSFSACHE